MSNLFYKTWLKAHKSVLSKRYNKPKKYSGSEKLIDGEFITHTYDRENKRRLLQMISKESKGYFKDEKAL